MRYQYENILLEIEPPKGSVIKDGKLIFKGHSYLAIKEFIRCSGNAPSVIQPETCDCCLLSLKTYSSIVLGLYFSVQSSFINLPIVTEI